MVEGLGTFRREFCGTYLLEVFIAAGLNDDPDHLARLAPLARSIGADAIQLNTAVRPAPGRRGLALSVDRLRALLPLFGPTAEVIASSGAAPRGPSAATQADILAVIERRPSTQADLAAALGLHVNEVAKALDALLAAGTIVEDGLHFRLRDRAGE
jgi:wyosine [tRNA(Phe)-imidazoG37] synthetase (radical SAM superfamily)